MSTSRPGLMRGCLGLLFGLLMMPGPLRAQSQQQRCDEYSNKIILLCGRLPTLSCPGAGQHPCYNNVNSFSLYRNACLTQRFGEAEYQRDLTKAQALVDECRPATPPSPPQPPAGKPCSSELAATYRNLLDEAAGLRARVAAQQARPLNPGNEPQRGVDEVRATIASATAAIESAAMLSPELEGVAQQLRSAQGPVNDLRSRLPRSADEVMRGLEEQQRVVANQISLIRDRADSQGCSLPAVAPPPAPAPSAWRVVARTPAAAMLAQPAPDGALDSLRLVLSGLNAPYEAEERRREIERDRAFNELVFTMSRGRGGPTQVTTPEATVRSEQTLYLVVRDPQRATTFVHVSRGAVAVAPLRGAAQRLQAGQSALVNATSVRLLAVGAPGGTALQPGMEPDTDRYGSDYANFDLPAANPQLCMDRCRGDTNCRAWTYIKPGVQGPSARCYLKNPAPPATPNNCCISGAIATPAEAQAGFEINTNRVGSDYTSFNLAQAVPEQCAARCSADGRCAAWTFVRPGVQGPSARCYLKDPAPPATPNNCCISGLRMDMDTDRYGSDYANFNLPAANPQLCQQRCESDGNCRAWTYVKPGQRGPSASCYLKNPAPAATPNACCISGVVKRGGEAQAFELNTDRNGSDIARFELPQAVPDQCFERCRGDNRCAAWTFVRPGVQGPNAVCYLKSPAPPPTANNCCISGAIAGRGTPPPPPPPPTTPPPGGAVAYLGCFRDQGASTGTEGRDLNGHVFSRAAMTTEICTDECRAKGFPYAGTQTGSYCFCGTSYGRSGPAGNCDIKCQGNTGQVCGGAWANSVYAVGRGDTTGTQSRVVPTGPVAPTVPTAPTAPRYVGCFKDPNNPFDLDGHLERSAQNTPERCIQTCAAKGYRYAGVQYGESCLCGQSYGRFGQASNCNVACTGNPRQVCGGGNANSVYDTGLMPTTPTAPTPRTPPPPPPAPASLGSVWNEAEGGEQAVWTRRPGTNTFDASWSNGRVRAVLEMSLQGNQVTIRRSQSSDGYECVYTGAINGNQASGTFGCNRFSGQLPWRATIR